ncbi:MAG: transketolase [Alphaproteobacteria bacterium]|nr:transketolase [Alphaproteobacteria bacterium]
MRNRFAQTIYDIACRDPRIAMVVADISPAGAMSEFAERFPDRFINVGVAEQVMIGMAAGMALRGLRPFAYTIATFALFRPFEMVRDDLAYQGLPVTVVGIGGGLAYSTLGGTHLAQDDIAVASAVPGLRVLAPCDPAETGDAAEFLAAEAEGPTYLRLGKAGEPILTQEATDPFVPGRVRCLRAGAGTVILGYGPILSLAMDLSDRIAEQTGVPATVVNVHTLKPLDHEGLRGHLSAHDRVIVLEEHVATGGLGQRIRSLAYDLDRRPRIGVAALQDRFIHRYGSRDALLAEHGLTLATLLSKWREM